MLRARYALRSLSDNDARSTPSTLTTPLSTVSRPLRQLSSVVLPQPDGPMIATMSPLGTAIETPFRAFTIRPSAWYVLTTSIASTANSGAVWLLSRWFVIEDTFNGPSDQG